MSIQQPQSVAQEQNQVCTLRFTVAYGFILFARETEIKNIILGEVQDEEISTTVQQLWISVNLARLQRIHGLTEKIKNRISGMKRKRPKESREPKKPKRSRPVKEPITEEHPVEQPVIGNLPNRSSNPRGDHPRCQKPSPRSMKQVKPSKNQPDNSTESPVKVKDADTTTITRGKNHIFLFGLGVGISEELKIGTGN